MASNRSKSPGSDGVDSTGMSPMMIAAAMGDAKKVDELVAAGESQSRRDHQGWTARDHAAYNGSVEIAEKFETDDAMESTSRPRPRPKHPPSIVEHPSDESHIIITMGSFVSDSVVEAVDIASYHVAQAHSRKSTSKYSLQINAVGARGASKRVPFSGRPKDSVELECTFLAKDPGQVQLRFSIFQDAPLLADSHGPVGTAVVLLSSLRHTIGEQRESLVRETTTPILAPGNLNAIGSVTFSYLVVTPFPQPKNSPPSPKLAREDSHPPTVIGHRGIGQNIADLKELQLGENTIESFLTAQKHGAEFVEFDVQITKDHVPVIYHDFLVAETGTDIPMHEITYEQFLHLDQEQTSLLLKTPRLPLNQPRPRSRSLNHYPDDVTPVLLSRLSHTHGYRTYGTKGNLRGQYVRQPFTTLTEMLTLLPHSLPFNIEIKYPILFETSLWHLPTTHIELNLFVNTILHTLNTDTQIHPRKIILSSFSPEICVALRLKQSLYPVLFLTDGIPLGDIRTDSPRAAISFANANSLSGVVLEATPLLLSPKLINHIQSQNLICASYGSQNDGVKDVDIQSEAGIDIIITNQVKKIVEHLHGGIERGT